MMDLTIDGVDGQVARTSSGDCGGCETLHDVHHVNDIISRDRDIKRGTMGSISRGLVTTFGFLKFRIA